MQAIKIYKEPTPEVLEEYSKLKLGDPEIVKKYEELYLRLIVNLVGEKEEYILYTVSKAPITEYCKKSPMIIAENISKRLKIPIIYGELKFNYNKDDFYDLGDERKAIIPEIKNIEKARNKKLLFLDDSFVTGNSLNVNLGLFQGVAKDFIFLYILDLSKSKYTEKEANTYILKKKGISFLKEIAGKDGFLPTSQFIRTFIDLPEKDKNEIYSELSQERRDSINKAVQLYNSQS